MTDDFSQSSGNESHMFIKIILTGCWARFFTSKVLLQCNIKYIQRELNESNNDNRLLLLNKNM